MHVLLATLALVAAEHPATKIIGLLEKLQVQVKGEAEAETAQFARFQTWCTDLTGDKKKVIATANGKISISSAEIEALTEDLLALEADIESLNTEMTSIDASITSLQSQRDSQNTEYGKARADLEGTILAVDGAITSLESTKPDPALVQHALEIAKVQKPKATAFLQKEDPADNFSNSVGREREYDFKSGGVIGVLKQLKTDFENDLTECNAQERNSANAHALAEAAKQDESKAAERAHSAKTALQGRKGQDKAAAETDLEEANTDLNSATAVLEKTKSTCRTRTDEFNERSKRREGEIAAMNEAVEVMEKVTGVRDPADKKGGGRFLFLQLEDPKTQIVNLLKKAGSTKRTAALAKLADKIAALKQTPGSGIFDSIKNMIQKMIFHLGKEQTDEDNHKNWCDNEHQKTNQTIDEKETKKEEFDADIFSLTEEVASLRAAVADNTVDVSNMQSQMEEATADRNVDQTENTATIHDSEQAQQAVAQAIAVLKDFYKSTGEIAKEPWEFVQTSAHVRRVTMQEDPKEPELWEGGGAGYTSTEGSQGVISLLTTVASDFASMEAKARADETTQQDEFDAQMTALKIDVSTTTKDTEMKTSRTNRLSEKLEGKEADNAHNQKELDANVQYHKDLFHACDDGDSSYDDRKQARTDEIDALKKAQGILEVAFKEEPAF